MKSLPNLNLDAIVKVYKILPHHEIFPLVLRLQFKDQASIDIDTDNYGIEAVTNTEKLLTDQGFDIEEIDLTDEEINFTVEGIDVGNKSYPYSL